MIPDDTTHLTLAIARANVDPESRKQLITFAYKFLEAVSRKMFRKYHALQRLHETGSIINESVIRLLMALHKVEIRNLEHFYSLVACQIRRVILDLLRKNQRNEKHQFEILAHCPREADEESLDLAIWWEFHQAVGKLPETERQVFDLVWYCGLTQKETARVLEVHPREVSRRWCRACLRLRRVL